MDSIPSSGIFNLSAYPVTDVASVEYRDSDNVLQTLVEDTDYYLDLDNRPCRIEVYEMPTVKERVSAWKVTFTAGYSEANTPKPMLEAMLMICASLYEKRGDGKPRNKIIEEFSFDGRVLHLLDTSQATERGRRG
jgi:uncharacterized phiE125 gp8 family phage protein